MYRTSTFLQVQRKLKVAYVSQKLYECRFVTRDTSPRNFVEKSPTKLRFAVLCVRCTRKNKFIEQGRNRRGKAKEKDQAQRL